jgi:hypothetical protein
MLVSCHITVATHVPLVEAGTAYPFGAHSRVRIGHSLVFFVVLCRPLFVFVIELSVMQFTASDYPFCFSKLFSYTIWLYSVS